MLVWEDGGFEHNEGFILQPNDPSTVAGKYYGGHEPCEMGNNYQLCGDWISTGNFSFLFFKLRDIMIPINCQIQSTAPGDNFLITFLQIQQKN